MPKTSITYQAKDEDFSSLTSKEESKSAAPFISAAGEGAARVENPLAQWATGPLPEITTEDYQAAQASPAVGADDWASKLIAKGKKYLGTPYVWGGTKPGGFDCSGYTQWVYRQLGVNLPRISYQQGNMGPQIKVDQLQPGDLVFWDNSSRNNGADHVEIFVGRDAQGRAMVMGAPAPGKQVRIRTLSASEGKIWGVSMAQYRGKIAGKSGAASTSARGGGVDAYLAALRRVESSNNYTARSRISSASGAYQYIRSTWNNYGGYAEAWMAPASVQDARARADAMRLYRRFGNWEQVAAYHLYPAWAGDRSRWNQAPGRGNPTVAQYVQKVMAGMGG